MAYVIKRSRRARRLRFVVKPGGVFEVVAPWGLSTAIIEMMLKNKAEWIQKHIRIMQTQGARLSEKESKAKYQEYKEDARALAHERLEFFNRVYGLRWNQVRIKRSKTRWGSCSKKGNLNFNYRIALLPPELSDYIIVHELCHLGQLNHSAKFWALVARTIPDHVARRRAIRAFSLE